MVSRNDWPFQCMRGSQIRNLILLALLLALILLVLTSTIANFVIEYNWWKEVAQVGTWISMLWYSIAPSVAGALVAFIALWVAHARGLHFAGVRRGDFRLYSRLVLMGLAVVALLFASASIDYWTIMRFFGSRGVTLPPATWTDPVFSRALPFYLFDLPFYSELLGFVFVLAILCALVFWATARGWQLWLRGGSLRTFDLGPHALLLPGATRTSFVRVIAVILLLGFATWVFLGNYDITERPDHRSSAQCRSLQASAALPRRNSDGLLRGPSRKSQRPKPSGRRR